MTLQSFLQNTVRRVLLCKNFSNWQFLAESAMQCLIIIECRVPYSARNFPKSSFSNVTKFRNAGLPTVRSQLRIKSIFAEKRNSGTIKIWGAFLLLQAILIFSIKPISSSIS